MTILLIALFGIRPLLTENRELLGVMGIVKFRLGHNPTAATRPEHDVISIGAQRKGLASCSYNNKCCVHPTLFQGTGMHASNGREGVQL